MNITELQCELRKCCVYPCRWGTVQNDKHDLATRFVYRESSFATVNRQIDQLSSELQGYARTRWLSYWSAQGVQAIFAAHPRVRANADLYDKTIDFWIDGIAFDHKTTVFPRAFPGGARAALAYPRALIDWLYTNQSQGQRHHDANRLFLVLWANDDKHWRLKAELCALEDSIHQYLDYFDPEQLHTLPNGAQTDCLWCAPLTQANRT